MCLGNHALHFSSHAKGQKQLHFLSCVGNDSPLLKICVNLMCVCRLHHQSNGLLPEFGQAIRCLQLCIFKGGRWGGGCVGASVGTVSEACEGANRSPELRFAFDRSSVAFPQCTFCVQSLNLCLSGIHTSSADSSGGFAKIVQIYNGTEDTGAVIACRAF